MLPEVLVQLEHGHLVLAEDLPEGVVGHDLAAVFRVLEVVALDVFPNLADHFATGKRLRADYGGEVARWSDWFLQCILRRRFGRHENSNVGRTGLAPAFALLCQ